MPKKDLIPEYKFVRGLEKSLGFKCPRNDVAGAFEFISNNSHLVASPPWPLEEVYVRTDISVPVIPSILGFGSRNNSKKLINLLWEAEGIHLLLDMLQGKDNGNVMAVVVDECSDDAGDPLTQSYYLNMIRENQTTPYFVGRQWNGLIDKNVIVGAVPLWTYVR